MTSRHEDHRRYSHSSSQVIAIVGMGPKGLQCFERLLAELANRPVENRGVCIHIFESNGVPGASRVYHPNLPQYLAVNNSKPDEITATAATPTLPCVTNIPTFMEWRRSNTGEDGLGASASRASVGRYLRECGRALVAAAPAGVAVQVHAAEVVDVDADAPELLIRARRSDNTEFTLASGQLLLATGHGMSGRSAPALHDAERLLGGVVAVRGLGLAALDLIFELTEGRGGRFLTAPDGGLEYNASGLEPAKLLPCCRTGVPILPAYTRREGQVRQLSAFTLGHLESIGHNRPTGLNWWSDLWPLAELEFRRQFEAAFDHFASLGVMGSTVVSRGQSFQSDLLLTPRQLAVEVDDFEYAARVRRCMGLLLSPVETDVALHAYRFAVSTWYEISEVLGHLCRHELLEPDSHVHLVRGVAPVMRRTAFGAATDSMRKLTALVDAGIVDFSMLRAEAVDNRSNSTGYTIRSRCGRVTNIDAVVDAFFDQFDLRTVNSVLYRSLLKRGAIRPHVLRGAVSTDGATGAVDITAAEQWVINRQGRIDDRISIVGIPTEGRVLNTWTISPDAFPGEWASRVCYRATKGFTCGLHPGVK